MKNNIVALRKQRNITQSDLAYALNTTRQTVSSLETGRYNPSIEIAFKLSRFFELPIEEIFVYEEEMEGLYLPVSREETVCLVVLRA